MCHAPVCLIPLRRSLRTLHLFLPSSTSSSWSYFIFYVDRFGVTPPCAPANEESCPFGQQRPSQRLWDQLLRRLPLLRDHSNFSPGAVERHQALVPAWLGDQWQHHRQSALTHTHGSSVHKCWLHAHVVISLWLSFSRLMFHPSSFAVPPRSLWDHPHDVPVRTVLPNFPDLKAQVKRTPHVATWPSPSSSQVMNPRSSTRTLSWMLTRRSSTIISDFSKTTNENTRQFGVSTVFEPSVLHVSHLWFLFLREKACNRETVVRQRWSVLQSRCQWKVDGTVFGVILFRLTEHSILMNEISENTWNEELSTLFLVTIQFRENFTWLSTTWRSKILERRNSE